MSVVPLLDPEAVFWGNFFSDRVPCGAGKMDTKGVDALEGVMGSVGDTRFKVESARSALCLLVAKRERGSSYTLHAATQPVIWSHFPLVPVTATHFLRLLFAHLLSLVCFAFCR